MGTTSFVRTANLPTGDNAVAIAIADLDRDGDRDLVVAAQQANQVHVLLNNGDATFAPSAGFPSGNQPTAVAIADFDRDANLDIVAAANQQSAVTVLRGTGAGIFLAPIDAAQMLDLPRAVVTADFDANGVPDIAVSRGNVTGTQPGSATVLVNLGTGGFRSPVDYPAQVQPRGLAAGDLDGDGRPDLAISNSGSVMGNSVTLLIGTGDGNFVERGSPLPTGTGAVSVAIGDVDGNGTNDLVSADNGNNGFSLILNGGAAFQQRANVPGAPRPSGVTLRDLDGDELLDIVASCQMPTLGMAFLHGLGGGAFTAAEVIASGNTGNAIAVADLDGDERLDVVIVGNVATTVGDVAILLNQCN